MPITKRTIALLSFCVLLPQAATAEWLAFKDGTTTETKGPWKVQGRRVIFTSQSGTLSAVKLDEIDLPISEQLSKNAEADRGLIEVKSSPTEAYNWRLVAAGRDVTPIGNGLAIVTEWSLKSGKFVGRHPGLSCVPTRLVGVSSGTDWWIQTGTQISKFRPIGLASADVEALQALVPDGLFCFEADRKIKSPDAAGTVIGYAKLPDGRDIGLELLRSRNARLNDETFSERNYYLAKTRQ